VYLIKDTSIPNSYQIYLLYDDYLLLMTLDREFEDSESRGEVSLQEHQKIAEESKHVSSGQRRDPKNRGEVSLQEQQKIPEESNK